MLVILVNDNKYNIWVTVVFQIDKLIKVLSIRKILLRIMHTKLEPIQ